MVTGYKINIQKSIIVLHTVNTWNQKLKIASFTIIYVNKREKYLSVDLTKYV